MAERTGAEATRAAAADMREALERLIAARGAQFTTLRGFVVVYLVSPVDVRPAIVCITCGMASFNRNDVKEKYCGHCHRFHEG